MGFLNYLPQTSVLLALSVRRGGLSRASSTGVTYFLDNSNADASDTAGRGTFHQPFRTLAFAAAQATAGRGDTLIVMSGHDETIDSANSLDCDGLSIRGEGFGTNIPKFRQSAAAGVVTLAGDGMLADNLLFQAGADAAQAVVLSGTGCVINECLFLFTGTGIQVDDCITLSGAHCAAIGNQILYISVVSPFNDRGIRCGAVTGLRVIGNYIHSNFTVAAIGFTGSASGAVVRDNLIYNGDSTGIAILCNGSGTLRDNGGYGANATLGNLVTASNFACIENYFTNNLANSGAIVPTTRAS